MIELIIATHTTTAGAWCSRGGGCDTDPVTLALSLAVGATLIIGWLIRQARRP